MAASGLAGQSNLKSSIAYRDRIAGTFLSYNALLLCAFAAALPAVTIGLLAVRGGGENIVACQRCITAHPYGFIGRQFVRFAWFGTLFCHSSRSPLLAVAQKVRTVCHDSGGLVAASWWFLTLFCTCPPSRYRSARSPLFLRSILVVFRNPQPNLLAVSSRRDLALAGLPLVCVLMDHAVSGRGTTRVCPAALSQGLSGLADRILQF